MKKLLFFIIPTLFIFQSYAFANSGRISYINLKSEDLLLGELITVRDSLIVLSTNFPLDDRKITQQIDSLIIINCNQINYIKLLEEKAPRRNRYLFSIFGLGAGIAIAVSDYNQNKSLKVASYLAIPVGLIVGYLIGAYFDVPNYKEEEIVAPDCAHNFKNQLIAHCRYSSSEPPRFKSRLNKILATKFNK